ncbi:MAG: hypothetical protein EOS85_28295 [Mesorhizobium sp.]|nr:MAG: hypothetical protein EOS85_28295 [Mesorhizobium sp.]
MTFLGTAALSFSQKNLSHYAADAIVLSFDDAHQCAQSKRWLLRAMKITTSVNCARWFSWLEGIRGDASMKKFDWIVALVAAIVLIVCTAWASWARYAPAIAQWWLHNQTPQAAGAWGDSFGAFNALFGALGFSAVLGTLLLQGRALRRQQEDQHRQRFESSFFELLRLFREARVSIKFNHSQEYKTEKNLKLFRGMMTYEGQDAFRAAMLEIRYWIQQADLPTNADKKMIGDLYRKRIHNPFESKLGPYFRLMYTILQRISEDPILTSDEKRRYGNLLRSQITSHEAAMAGLNGLAPVSKDFSRLVTEFRLLKYVPNSTIRRMLARYYPEETFQGRKKI